jgi:RecA/RadA recombinase
LRCGTVTELHGDVGSGRSQVCLELLVNAVAFYSDGQAVYISTKGDFFQDPINRRLNHLIKMRREYNQEITNPKDYLKRIHYVCAEDLGALFGAISDSVEMIERGEKIKLIVIDTFCESLLNDLPDYLVGVLYKMHDQLQAIARKKVNKKFMHVIQAPNFNITPSIHRMLQFYSQTTSQYERF